MPKRQKCSSCSSGWCKNHLFELKPLLGSLYFRKIQKVRLCPRPNKSTKTFQSSLPLVNKDGKYYTPSFILEEEKSFYSENDRKMLKNHEQKIQEMVQGVTGSIWVAKHGRKRKYCTVCHFEYEDYLEHISQQSHKDKIQKNRYTGYIKEMASEYEKRRKILIKSQTIEQTSDVVDKIPAQHNPSNNDCENNEKEDKVLNFSQLPIQPFRFDQQ